MYLKLKRTDLAAVLILTVGLFQIAGYCLNSSVLKGLGFASAIAPFPKVFSDVDGLETFASEFTLIITDSEGKITEQLITPELYSLLSGPYNRRNVYGAALSYAPRMKKEIWTGVFCYAFNNPAVLVKELNLPAGRISIRIKTRTAGRDDQWILDPVC